MKITVGHISFVQDDEGDVHLEIDTDLGPVESGRLTVGQRHELAAALLDTTPEELETIKDIIRMSRGPT